MVYLLGVQNEDEGAEFSAGVKEILRNGETSGTVGTNLLLFN